MEKFSKEYFKHLARDIMFDISDEEVSQLQVEFASLTKQLEILDEINTDEVEPMVYPFAQETSFMREDKVDHVIEHEDAMKNVKSVKISHVHVPKVVK